MIDVNIPTFAYRKDIILQNISIALEEGKTHGIVGLNGSGKTTLFKMMAGLLKSDGCNVIRNGNLIPRKEIAFIDTDLFFYPKLSAREFLNVFPQTNNNYNETELAGLFRLPLDELIEEFSTGMKKKLLIMSQLKQNKEIYILDEPFNGLDLETNKILEIIISTLNLKGKTVLISSHILDPLLNICHRIHFLKEKSIHRTFEKEDFSQIEEELFGKYSRELKDKMKGMI